MEEMDMPLMLRRIFLTAMVCLVVQKPSAARACNLKGDAGSFTAFGAGAHGGERLQSDFLKGQRQAAHVVSAVRQATLYRATTDEAVRAWVLANKEQLKQTIEQSRIEFNDNASQVYCALVRDAEPLLVQVSRPRCQNIISTPKAGELIIHEAVHMMGIDSETFAATVAFALYQAWEQAGHLLDNRLHSINVENAPTGREHHTGVWTGEDFIVWGGFTRTGETSTGGRYDHVLDEWLPTSANKALDPRFGHTAVWDGRNMLVWGGAVSVGRRAGTFAHYNDGAAYNPETDKWERLTLQGAPSARFMHTAVWTGQEMIIWGGARQVGGNTYEFLNDGAAYNPKTKTWRKLATINAPFARFGHTAVYLPAPINKMMVWGGQALDRNGQVQISDQGGVYDVTSHSWQATSVKGAPTPRTNHSMVSTGERVIVWGGTGYSDQGVRALNSGAIYNPKDNSWAALPVSNAPYARDGHAAVWTGSHMLIFGGRNPVAVEPEENGKGIEAYQTLGLFDLQKGEWSTPIISDVWMDRRFGAAVWTGHELVIWGGAGQRRSGRVFYP